LLTAELCRTDFEVLNEEGGEKDQRRALGDKIDALAKEGMEAAAALGETSEAYRIRSDFYALMIRSKFQGKKYRNKLETSSAKALELDPKNPYAYVSVSRPYLFAGPHQGGDLKKAMELLNKAIDLKPDYEAALQLRAVGYEKLGEKVKSDEEWKKILEKNPNAVRSRKTLEIAGKVWTEEDATGA
jgi:tetratricopeptide (TPR) repeat protein